MRKLMRGIQDTLKPYIVNKTRLMYVQNEYREANKLLVIGRLIPEYLAIYSYKIFLI